MVALNKKLGIDKEERVKLEPGVKMSIVSANTHQGKQYRIARIDAVVGNTLMHYYSSAVAVVSIIDALVDNGETFEEPIECSSVKRPNEKGVEYLTLE